MAKIDYRPLDDTEIVKLVEDNIKTSVGYYDSDLSRERKKVMEYYQGKQPKPAHDGNSKYVSQDVYNAVNSMQAALLKPSQLAIVLSGLPHKAQRMLKQQKSALHTQITCYSAKMMVTPYSAQSFMMV